MTWLQTWHGLPWWNPAVDMAVVIVAVAVLVVLAQPWRRR